MIFIFKYIFMYARVCIRAIRLANSLADQPPAGVVVEVINQLVNEAVHNHRPIRTDQMETIGRVVVESVTGGEDLTFNRIYAALEAMEAEE